MNTVVITFGRCQGPHIGHEMLFNFCQAKAAELGGDYKIYPTKTHNKANPFPYAMKLSMLKELMPSHANAIVEEHPGAIIKVVQSLQNEYQRLVFVCGSDRIDSFRKLLSSYNGLEYSFDDIEVISCGDRCDDGTLLQQASASLVRELVSDGDLDGYLEIAPTEATTYAAHKAFLHMGAMIVQPEPA